MHFRLAVAFVALLAAPGVQGVPEVPPSPPQGPTRALPPVEEPPRTAVERRDLLQQFSAASPIEGFYELRAFHAPGLAPVPTKGYLAVGRQYVSIHLLSPVARGRPVFQSAFRRYRIAGDTLHMTALLGFGNDEEDGVAIEEPGAMRSARWSIIGTRLRLALDGGRSLEFERIE